MRKVSNLNDALAYHLQRLVDAERMLPPAIVGCSKKASSAGLKQAMLEYARSSHDKLQKLERVFNYLLWEPGGNRNLVVRRMIHDTKSLLHVATTDEIKDVMLLACMENINYYKLAGYKTALAFAVALQLEIVSELLQEILNWEKETSGILTKLALEGVTLTALRSDLSE